MGEFQDAKIPSITTELSEGDGRGTSRASFEISLLSEFFGCSDWSWSSWESIGKVIDSIVSVIESCNSNESLWNNGKTLNFHTTKVFAISLTVSAKLQASPIE